MNKNLVINLLERKQTMKISTLTVIVILLIASLLATGCSNTNANAPTEATENADGSLNETTRLALGILSLEDTDQAVTVEQAKELLTLWQAYQYLGTSETTAAGELEAVVGQIKAILTTDQNTAVEEMGLTSASLGEVMQKFGIDFAGGGMPQMQATLESDSVIEGFPGGGMPPGGGGMPSGGFQRGGGGMQMDETMGQIMGAQGTPGANGQNQFGSIGSQVNPMLLRALISMLETKIGATN